MPLTTHLWLLKGKRKLGLLGSALQTLRSMIPPAEVAFWQERTWASNTPFDPDLDCLTLDPGTINNTLGTLLKYQDDIEKIRGSEAGRLLGEIKSEMMMAQSACTQRARKKAAI